MAKLAIGFAVALIALGVGGYFAAAAEARSLTALIPAIAGVLLLICGLLAMNPALRMHAMHGAAMVGLLGFLAPLGRLVPQAIKGTPPHGLALFSQVTMSVLCLVFLVLCVRSFVNARKARAATIG